MPEKPIKLKNKETAFRSNEELIKQVEARIKKGNKVNQEESMQYIKAKGLKGQALLDFYDKNMSQGFSMKNPSKWEREEVDPNYKVPTTDADIKNWRGYNTNVESMKADSVPSQLKQYLINTGYAESNKFGSGDTLEGKRIFTRAKSVGINPEMDAEGNFKLADDVNTFKDTDKTFGKTRTINPKAKYVKKVYTKGNDIVNNYELAVPPTYEGKVPTEQELKDFDAGTFYQVGATSNMKKVYVPYLDPKKIPQDSEASTINANNQEMVNRYNTAQSYADEIAAYKKTDEYRNTQKRRAAVAPIKKAFNDIKNYEFKIMSDKDLDALGNGGTITTPREDMYVKGGTTDKPRFPGKLETNVNTNPIVNNQMPDTVGKVMVNGKPYVKPPTSKDAIREDKKTTLSKVGDFLENPLPSSTGNNSDNMFNMIAGLPGQTLKAVYNTAKNASKPVDTAKKLGNAAYGIAGELVGDAQTTPIEPGLKIATDAAFAIPALSQAKALKNVLVNNKEVSKILEKIADKGVSQITPQELRFVKDVRNIGGAQVKGDLLYDKSLLNRAIIQSEKISDKGFKILLGENKKNIENRLESLKSNKPFVKEYEEPSFNDYNQDEYLDYDFVTRRNQMPPPPSSFNLDINSPTSGNVRNPNFFKNLSDEAKRKINIIKQGEPIKQQVRNLKEAIKNNANAHVEKANNLKERLKNNVSGRQKDEGYNNNILKQLKEEELLPYLGHTKDVQKEINTAYAKVKAFPKGHISYPAGSLSTDSHPLSTGMIERAVKEGLVDVNYRGLRSLNNLGFPTKAGLDANLSLKEINNRVKSLNENLSYGKKIPYGKIDEYGELMAPYMSVTRKANGGVIEYTNGGTIDKPKFPGKLNVNQSDNTNVNNSDVRSNAYVATNQVIKPTLLSREAFGNRGYDKKNDEKTYNDYTQEYNTLNDKLSGYDFKKRGNPNFIPDIKDKNELEDKFKDIQTFNNGFKNLNKILHIQSDASDKMEQLDALKQSNNNIKLTKGRYNLGSVNSALLDKVDSTAKANNIDPYDILKVMGRESNFGKLFKHGINNPDPKKAIIERDPNSLRDMSSAWDNEVPNPLLEKKYNNVNYNKSKYGWSTYTLNEKQLNNEIKDSDIANYKNKVDSYMKETPDALSYITKKIKNNDLKSYNPGDKEYVNKLNEEKKVLMQEPNLAKYLKTNKFAGGGRVPVEEPVVKSDLSTKIIRNVANTVLPTNAAQLAASLITKDSKYGVEDASYNQQAALFNTLENARKRTGKNKGGTEYIDYGKDFNTDLQNLKGNPLSIVLGSALSDDFNAATTFGRVSYDYDPKAQTYKVFDSYDYSKTPNTNTAYSSFRNAVGKAAEVRSIAANQQKAKYIGNMSKKDYTGTPKNLSDRIANAITPNIPYKNIKQVTGGLEKEIGNLGNDLKTGYKYATNEIKDVANTASKYYNKAVNTANDYFNLKPGNYIESQVQEAIKNKGLPKKSLGGRVLPRFYDGGGVRLTGSSTFNSAMKAPAGTVTKTASGKAPSNFGDNVVTGAGIAGAAVPMLTSFIPDDRITDSEGNEVGSKENMGKSILNSAAQGASMGAVAGPWGAAIGAGVGAIYGGVTNSMNNADVDRAQQQANMRIQNRNISNSVLTNKNMFSTNTSNNDQMIAAKGGTVVSEDMGNPNAELELNETFRDPMTGETGMVDGPSHDNGGIEMSLAEGTQIWSDRLKHNGRTFASLTKPIINKIANIEKGLDTNPNSRFKQNSIKLLNAQLDFFFDIQESNKQQDEMKRTLKKQEGGVVDDMGNYHYANGGIYIKPENRNKMSMGGNVLPKFYEAGTFNDPETEPVVPINGMANPNYPNMSGGKGFRLGNVEAQNALIGKGMGKDYTPQYGFSQDPQDIQQNNYPGSWKQNPYSFNNINKGIAGQNTYNFDKIGTPTYQEQPENKSQWYRRNNGELMQASALAGSTFAQLNNINRQAAPANSPDVRLTSAISNPNLVDLSAERGAINRSALGAMEGAQRGLGNSASALAFKNKARINQLQGLGQSFSNQEIANADIKNKFAGMRGDAAMKEAIMNSQINTQNNENRYAFNQNRMANQNAAIGTLGHGFGDIGRNRTMHANDMEKVGIINNRYDKSAAALAHRDNKELTDQALANGTYTKEDLIRYGIPYKWDEKKKYGGTIKTRSLKY